MSKPLDVTSVNDAKSKINDIKVFGDGDQWLLLGKASSESGGWMKSSKAMEIEGVGCCVQVTTQQRAPDGSFAVAEAVCFVPGVRVDTAKDETGAVIGRKLVRTSA